jgi:ABC-type multidrug transport system ATPase subunit
VRIEATGVGKRFGGVVALADVSFDVPPGGRVALVGPNGSGKSTLNRILMGLAACRGRVRIDGRCPFRERVAVARQMAYVPQVAPQLAAPVDEVVSAVARVRGIDRKQIAELAAAFDLDLAAIGARPFRALSGGTRQKLLLAIAFAVDAHLLILDEPTGSLDARARERFFERFEALGREVTLLLCSHRLEEIRPLVDQVLMLQDGRLAWDGPLDAFLARSAVATLEVSAEGAQAAAWLEARGFRRSASGAFLRSVDPATKLRLLAEIPQALGASLRNLNARDLEAIEVAKPGPADPRHA